MVAVAAAAVGLWPPGTDDVDSPRARQEAAVRAWCGACHVFADPSILPRHAWRVEVERGRAVRRYRPTGADRTEPGEVLRHVSDRTWRGLLRVVRVARVWHRGCYSVGCR